MFTPVHKLREKIDAAEIPAFVLVPAVLAACGIAILGLTAFLKLAFGNTEFTLDEIWSLMFAAFLSGFAVRLYQAESSRFAHVAIETRGKGARWLIAVSIFVLALSMASGLSLEFQNIQEGLPRAFLALGVFILVIALPWQSAAALSELESRKTQSSFSRYIVEGIQQGCSEWTLVACYSEGDCHMHALMREQQEADSGRWKELRVLFETGSVDVVTGRAT